jgi:hypothetical protein
MASDKKTGKAASAAKGEATAKNTSTPGEVAAKTPSSDAVAKDTSTPGEAAAKTAGGEAAAAPSNYSRGEGQKPVTAAYKENWNAIFGKKKSAKKSVKKTR